MADLIIPDASGRLPDGYREEIRLPVIEVPHHLQEDLDNNPRYISEFYRAVGDALNRSLQDERTRLRIITATALKERVEACYRTVITLRFDMRYSLKKCFDLLPGTFVEALARGERPEDTFDNMVQRNMWAKEGSARRIEVAKEDLHDVLPTESVDDDSGS